MKIDWKALAQSPGYRSLKAAYIKDVQEAAKRARPMRDKAEFLRLFTWVINRAQHYAIRQGRPIEEVLNAWETRRNGSWWLNAYGESRQPKLPSGKPRNVKYQKAEAHFRKEFKRGWYSSERAFKHLRAERRRVARSAREVAGKKARWSSDMKQRAALRREFLKQEN